MLDQVGMPHAPLADIGKQVPHDFQLMVAGEIQALLLERVVI